MSTTPYTMSGERLLELANTKTVGYHRIDEQDWPTSEGRVSQNWHTKLFLGLNVVLFVFSIAILSTAIAITAIGDTPLPRCIEEPHIACKSHSWCCCYCIHQADLRAAPAWEAVTYHEQQLQVDLFDTSPFKGQPRPELDAAWNGILNSMLARNHVNVCSTDEPCQQPL